MISEFKIIAEKRNGRLIAVPKGCHPLSCIIFLSRPTTRHKAYEIIEIKLLRHFLEKGAGLNELSQQNELGPKSLRLDKDRPVNCY